MLRHLHSGPNADGSIPKNLCHLVSQMIFGRTEEY